MRVRKVDSKRNAQLGNCGKAKAPISGNGDILEQVMPRSHNWWQQWDSCEEEPRVLGHILVPVRAS